MRSSVICALVACSVIVAACEGWKGAFRPKDASWDKLAVPRTPMPNTAFRVRWDASPTTTMPVMSAGAETDVKITFTNLGDAVWPDPLAGDPDWHNGGYAVRLAYDWTLASIVEAPRPEYRVDLPHPVHPGETMTLLVHLKGPGVAGSYRLVFQMVQELVAWFDDKGGAKLIVPVAVN